MANVDDIVEYYGNLLIVQYHNKPKAKAMVEAFARELIANGVVFDVRDGFSVDTAVGVQLDTVGKYIGLDRYYQQMILEDYFALIDYAEVDSPPPEKIGLADYSDFDTKVGHMLIFTDLLSTNLALSDDDYRFVLKLKIIQNYSNNSHKTIDDAMYEFFGNLVRAESSGDMEMTYYVPLSQTAAIFVAIQKAVFMRPMGVSATYVYE